MNLIDIVYHVVFISSIVLLVTSIPTALAYDRPAITLVSSLAVVGAVLLLANKSESLAWPRRRHYEAYAAVPHQDFELDDDRSPSSHTRIEVPLSRSPVTLRTLAAGAVLAVAVRIELYRRIAEASECTVASVEVFLPLVIAIYDGWRHQKSTALAVEEKPESSFYDAMYHAVERGLIHTRFRYISPAFALALGCYLMTGLWNGLNSTYICPVSVGHTELVPTQLIPTLQFVNVALDGYLAVTAYEFLLQQSSSARSRGAGAFMWGIVMVASSLSWILAAVTVCLVKREYREKVPFINDILAPNFLLSLLGQIILFLAFVISGAYCLLTDGLVNTSMTATGLITAITGFRFLWLASHTFPPAPFTATTVSFALVCFGWLYLHRLRRHLGSEGRLSSFYPILTLLGILVLLWPGLMRKRQVHFHPIDMLMYDARTQHEEYVRQASQSRSLPEAVVQYRTRYARNPPPGFDVWYEYATNRSVFIIDEYDQIYNDLLPFRMTAPEQLRRQTWEMVSNPWNEISAVTIRGGVAAVAENVIPTHRWMLEGVAILINSFARYLPDMDLAFNLNDECRVAVPYEAITETRRQGKMNDKTGFESWSANRAEGWFAIPEHDFAETVFEDASFRPSFEKYGSIGCSPSSPARTNPHVSSNAHTCLSCAVPHSMGQFTSNWSLAADVCHQPDLAHLHGFYLSPAAFKTSRVIRPVFSQSKVHGFNDILYPSAWNYMDKVSYAPRPPSGEPGTDQYDPGSPDLDYLEKDDRLFWRGATSEGVSVGRRTWRGMTRQRLVHMTNNLTDSAHDRATVLLPDPARPGKLLYHVLSATALTQLGFRSDVSIVDHIDRCGGIGLYDCKDQEKEFGLVPPTDFGTHWKYRFLMDMDGAAFSGRFLPFLQSKSLPFKTALFREWYDSRITAWHSFVPVSIRLVELWSILAYFQGVAGKFKGIMVKWAPHLKEGELIASQGRDWANKVLRKEDMEAYFFRLCLEWARLTDDRRDDLGFSV